MQLCAGYIKYVGPLRWGATPLPSRPAKVTSSTGVSAQRVFMGGDQRDFAPVVNLPHAGHKALMWRHVPAGLDKSLDALDRDQALREAVGLEYCDALMFWTRDESKRLTGKRGRRGARLRLAISLIYGGGFLSPLATFAPDFAADIAPD